MLSILVVCVGVIEALSCFEHFQFGIIHCATTLYEHARRRSSLLFGSRTLKLLPEDSITEEEENSNEKPRRPFMSLDETRYTVEESEDESPVRPSLISASEKRKFFKESGSKTLDKDDKVNLVKKLLESPQPCKSKPQTARPRAVRSISMPEVVHTKEDIALAKIINELAIEPIEEVNVEDVLEEMDPDTIVKEFDRLFEEVDDMEDKPISLDPVKKVTKTKSKVEPLVRGNARAASFSGKGRFGFEETKDEPKVSLSENKRKSLPIIGEKTKQSFVNLDDKSSNETKKIEIDHVSDFVEGKEKKVISSQNSGKPAKVVPDLSEVKRGQVAGDDPSPNSTTAPLDASLVSAFLSKGKVGNLSGDHKSKVEGFSNDSANTSSFGESCKTSDNKSSCLDDIIHSDQSINKILESGIITDDVVIDETFDEMFSDLKDDLPEIDVFDEIHEKILDNKETEKPNVKKAPREKDNKKADKREAKPETVKKLPEDLMPSDKVTILKNETEKPAPEKVMKGAKNEQLIKNEETPDIKKKSQEECYLKEINALAERIVNFCLEEAKHLPPMYLPLKPEVLKIPTTTAKRPSENKNSDSSLQCETISKDADQINKSGGVPVNESEIQKQPITGNQSLQKEARIETQTVSENKGKGANDVVNLIELNGQECKTLQTAEKVERMQSKFPAAVEPEKSEIVENILINKEKKETQIEGSSTAVPTPQTHSNSEILRITCETLPALEYKGRNKIISLPGPMFDTIPMEWNKNENAQSSQKLIAKETEQMPSVIAKEQVVISKTIPTQEVAGSKKIEPNDDDEEEEEIIEEWEEEEEEEEEPILEKLEHKKEQNFPPSKVKDIPKPPNQDVRQVGTSKPIKKSVKFADDVLDNGSDEEEEEEEIEEVEEEEIEVEEEEDEVDDDEEEEVTNRQQPATGSNVSKKEVMATEKFEKDKPLAELKIKDTKSMVSQLPDTDRLSKNLASGSIGSSTGSTKMVEKPKNRPISETKNENEPLVREENISKPAPEAFWVRPTGFGK